MPHLAHKITDGVWTVEVLVDEDGRLNIWATAYDGGTPMDICDEPDMSDNESSWGTKLSYSSPPSSN